MKRSTVALLGTSAGVMAAYLFLQHDSLVANRTRPDKTVDQGGIEQVIALEQDSKAKGHNSTATGKKQDSSRKEIATGERPSGGYRSQESQVPTPPSLYQTWKTPLEQILKAEVRLLYDDYDYSQRRTGDWYLVEGDNTITINQVRDEQQPPYTDKFLLNIIREDDGSYTTQGENIPIDEDASAPYIALNGTQEAVQDKLPHLIEWQQAFGRVLEQARAIQDDQDLSPDQKRYFIYTKYRDGFQHLRETGIMQGILNPATAGVLDSTVEHMRESWESQRDSE